MLDPEQHPVEWIETNLIVMCLLGCLYFFFSTFSEFVGSCVIDESIDRRSVLDYDIIID